MAWRYPPKQWYCYSHVKGFMQTTAQQKQLVEAVIQKQVTFRQAAQHAEDQKTLRHNQACCSDAVATAQSIAKTAVCWSLVLYNCCMRYLQLACCFDALA